MTGPYTCPFCGRHYEDEDLRHKCEVLCAQPYDDSQDH